MKSCDMAVCIIDASRVFQGCLRFWTRCACFRHSPGIPGSHGEQRKVLEEWSLFRKEDFIMGDKPYYTVKDVVRLTGYSLIALTSTG